MPDINLPARRDDPVPLIPHPIAPRRRGASVVLVLGFALALALGLGLVLGLGLGLTLTNRESTHAAPTIQVGPVIVAQPSSPTPLPIQVGPPELIPQQGWIRIVGLPPFASLSQGHVIAPGSWSVPLGRLLGLVINAPSEDGARSRVTIALMSPQGSVLAEAQTMFIVAPASRIFPTSARSPATRPAALEMACPGVAARPEPFKSFSDQGSRRRAELLVQAGDRRLADGNVAAAREFYKRAAEMGWSPAAFALGATYDPEAPRGLLHGIGADLKQARCWYERARELAGVEAAAQGKN
jgi:hypothetical protein